MEGQRTPASAAAATSASASAPLTGVTPAAVPAPATQPEPKEALVPGTTPGVGVGEEKKATTTSPTTTEPPAPAREKEVDVNVLCVTEKGDILPVGKDQDAMFIQSLRRFILVRHGQQLGHGQYKIPRLGKEDVNLALLYRSVLNCGGYQNCVTRKGSWRNVAIHMKVPSTVTNSAYMLRTHYEKYLLDYECTFWKKGIDFVGGGGMPPPSALMKASDLRKGGAQAMRQTKQMQPGVGSGSALKPGEQGKSSIAQSRMVAMQQVQEIMTKISPSIGPYFVVPANFEIKRWNEIMRALTSGTMKGLSWSLNTLALIVYDARNEVCLPKLPGLLGALVTVVNSCLVEYPIGIKRRSRETSGSQQPRGASNSNNKTHASSGVKSPGNRKQGQGAAAQAKEPSNMEEDKDNPWWWTLESYDIVSPDEETYMRSTQAVAACQIIRNLSFTRGNAEHIAAHPYCVGCLVRCLGHDLLFRHGTDGSRLRFASLDTLSNIGACVSLPNLGMLGKGLMQQVAILLGAPIMMDGETVASDVKEEEDGRGSGDKGSKNLDKVGDDDDAMDDVTKGAVLACDLLSQLSLGTENAHLIQQESCQLGIVAWLTTHLKIVKGLKAGDESQSRFSLLCAAVSALQRLVSLPGSEETIIRVCRQRWCLGRLIKVSTANSIEQVQQLAQQYKDIRKQRNATSVDDRLEKLDIFKGCVPVAAIYEGKAFHSSHSLPFSQLTNSIFLVSLFFPSHHGVAADSRQPSGPASSC